VARRVATGGADGKVHVARRYSGFSGQRLSAGSKKLRAPVISKIMTSYCAAARSIWCTRLPRYSKVVEFMVGHC
jgi:hypothetical protein